MIRLACWLGGVGAFSSLSLYVLMRIGIPAPVVAALRILLPAFLIWLSFKRFLFNRPWIRLFYVIGSFVMALLFVVLLLSQPFNAIFPTNVRIAVAFVESTALLLLAFLVPLSLGTPSIFRSALRIGFAAIVVVPIHFEFDALADLFASLGEHRLYPFGILFGLPAVKWSFFFAALAPDHIAMERAALARKSLPNCEKCEYDLTGNVSGVCPECGTALSDALRQRLLLRRENAWETEEMPAKEIGKE